MDESSFTLNKISNAECKNMTHLFSAGKHHTRDFKYQKPLSQMIKKRVAKLFDSWQILESSEIKNKQYVQVYHLRDLLKTTGLLTQ